jgi:hypothetical protein
MDRRPHPAGFAAATTRPARHPKRPHRERIRFVDKGHDEQLFIDTGGGEYRHEEFTTDEDGYAEPRTADEVLARRLHDAVRAIAGQADPDLVGVHTRNFVIEHPNPDQRRFPYDGYAASFFDEAVGQLVLETLVGDAVSGVIDLRIIGYEAAIEDQDVAGSGHCMSEAAKEARTARRQVEQVVPLLSGEQRTRLAELDARRDSVESDLAGREPAPATVQAYSGNVGSAVDRPGAALSLGMEL